MLGIEFEIVNTLSAGIQRIRELAEEAVVFENGHVVVVALRVTNSGVVRRRSQKPDIKILAISKGASDSSNGLAPMAEHDIGVLSIRERYGQSLLSGEL